MDRFFEFIKRAFIPGEPTSPLPAGVHHYQTPADHPLNYRLHLRLEPDGSGLLIINASTVLHLNQTAAEYAYHYIHQTSLEEALRQVSERYQVSFQQAQEDYTQLIQQVEALIDIPDLDPVTYLGLERHAPYTDEISAPYRLDCALTYRVPDPDAADATPVKRVDRELTTEEWKSIIQKSWQAGIPHVIFTGGEPTLREDLPELIAYAEELGQVTGLLTDGLKLADSAYLQSLLEAGLDHTMIILQPHEEKTWESLSSFSYWSETMDEDLFVAVHLTLTDANVGDRREIISKLASAGISAISLSANSKALSEALRDAQEIAYEYDLELVWDIPVPYSGINPIALELSEEGEGYERTSGAARGWLYLEPDGDVLPGQGINQVLGNLLSDEWASVWESAIAFRQED